MGFGSCKAALYMCNRIRAGLSEHKPDKLAGEIEKTYAGEKDSNKHRDKRSAVPAVLVRARLSGQSNATAMSSLASWSISTATRWKASSRKPSPKKLA